MNYSIEKNLSGQGSWTLTLFESVFFCLGL